MNDMRFMVKTTPIVIQELVILALITVLKALVPKPLLVILHR